MRELFDAVKANNPKLIDAISQQSNFKPDMVDQSGFTPTMWAAHFGYLDVLELLFQKGANVEIRDRNGSTLMHFAAESGNLDVMKNLKQKGLSYDELNKNNKTPLHYLTQSKSPNSIECLEELIINGVRLDIKNSIGDTPLASAIKCNNIEMAKVLAKATGEDANIDAYSTYRICATILNHSFLDAKLKNIGLMTLDNGGSPIESYDIIKQILRDFIREKNDHPYIHHFQELLDKALSKSHIKRPTEFSEKTDKDFFLSKTGHHKHVFYFYVKKESSGYQFHFAERGLFARKSECRVSQVSPFFSLNVPQERVFDVLSKLEAATTSNNDEASQIIFSQVPKMANDYFRYRLFDKSPFKGARCFIENLKSIIHLMLMEGSDKEQGNLLYKELILFMEQRAVTQIKNVNLPFEGKDEAVSRLESHLEYKSKQLTHLQEKYRLMHPSW